MVSQLYYSSALILLFLSGLAQADCLQRGTGDMGVIIERASGSLLIVETSHDRILFRLTGLGDLSHASVVFSRDQRYAFIFGRDGGLSKVDLLCGRLVKRIKQAGNSIGGAISQDGRLIAVSNYDPGGVKIFSSDDLSLIADIPASPFGDKRSKTVGLVDAVGQKFVVSLYDTGEIWVLDLSQPQKPQIQKFKSIGRQPYDALITPNGRYYISGLFGEDGLVLLDLWYLEQGPKRILDHYGHGKKRMPVYKMPHLEGWAIAGDHAFFPAIGYSAVLVANTRDWQAEGQIQTIGQPVFVMARPDGRYLWVNFAFPDNQYVQIIDVEKKRVIQTLTPGKGTLHLEFTPRGEEVWISVRDRNEVQIYDTEKMRLKARLPAQKPSGIFFTDRANRIGL